MLHNPILFTIITMTIITIGHSTAFGEENNPLYLSLEIGAEYDDNITVDALDLTSQQGDGAALIEGAIEYDFINNEDNSFTFGYNFSQNIHFEQTEFDLQTHGATLEATTKLQDINLGIAYNFYDISLGNEDFLQMHILRPSFYTMITPKTLFIGGYEYLKQNFQQPSLIFRDSDRHSADLKTYFLLGNGRTINIGYKLSNNNAVASQLDYWGHIFDVGFKLPFEAIEGSKFTARYRYNQKNYTNITPILDEKRKDKRHSIRAAFELPMMDQFTAMLQYEFIDSTSNFRSLVYSNHLFSFKVGCEF